MSSLQFFKKRDHDILAFFLNVKRMSIGFLILLT